MIQLKSLENISFECLFWLLEDALKDSALPVPQMQETFLRWEEAGVDFSLSLGAFCQDELIGFSLFVPVGSELFNFMTAVCAPWRGQGIASKMLKAIEARSNGFKTMKLEVHQKNSAAVRLYQKLGYNKKRTLIALKGQINLDQNDGIKYQYRLGPLKISTMDALTEPSLENSFSVLDKRPNSHELHEIFFGEIPLAFAFYSPRSLGLRQIGAKNEAALDELLKKMQLNHEKICLMGIAEESVLVKYFLSRGLKIFCESWEMEKTITP